MNKKLLLIFYIICFAIFLLTSIFGILILLSPELYFLGHKVCPSSDYEIVEPPLLCGYSGEIGEHYCCIILSNEFSNECEYYNCIIINNFQDEYYNFLPHYKNIQLLGILLICIPFFILLVLISFSLLISHFRNKGNLNYIELK